jgi:hypothetical protein
LVILSGTRLINQIDNIGFTSGQAVNTVQWFATITLTHEPVIVTTASTSTIVTSSTNIVIATVTVTVDQYSTITPAVDIITDFVSKTQIAPPTTTTLPTTVTPKASTLTLYQFITQTETCSCLPFTYPPQAPCQQRPFKGQWPGSPPVCKAKKVRGRDAERRVPLLIS